MQQGHKDQRSRQKQRHGGDCQLQLHPPHIPSLTPRQPLTGVTTFFGSRSSKTEAAAKMLPVRWMRRSARIPRVIFVNDNRNASTVWLSSQLIKMDFEHQMCMIHSFAAYAQEGLACPGCLQALRASTRTHRYLSLSAQCPCPVLARL